MPTIGDLKKLSAKAEGYATTAQDAYGKLSSGDVSQEDYMAAASAAASVVESLDPDLGKAVEGAVKGIEIGAGVGTAVLVGVGALVVYGASIGAAIGAAFGPLAPFAVPIAAAIGAIVGFLCVYFASHKMTPEEARAKANEFHRVRHTAIQLLQNLNDGKHSTQRWAAQQVGFLSYLETIAGLGDDPTAFLQVPQLRAMYRVMLAKQGVFYTGTDAQLMAEASKRAQAIQGAWKAGIADAKRAIAIQKPTVQQAQLSAAEKLRAMNLTPAKLAAIVQKAKDAKTIKAISLSFANGTAKSALLAVASQKAGAQPKPAAAPPSASFGQLHTVAAQAPTQPAATNNDMGTATKIGLGLALAYGAAKLFL